MVKLRKVVEGRKKPLDPSDREDAIKAFESLEVEFTITESSSFSDLVHSRPVFIGELSSIWDEVIDWSKENLTNYILRELLDSFEDGKLEKTKTFLLKKYYKDLMDHLNGTEKYFYFQISNRNLSSVYRWLRVIFTIEIRAEIRKDSILFSYKLENRDMKLDLHRLDEDDLYKVLNELLDGYLKKFSRDMNSVFSKCSSEWKSKLQEKLDYISTSIQEKAQDEGFDYVASWSVSDPEDSDNIYGSSGDFVLDSKDFQKSLEEIGPEILSTYAKYAWPDHEEKQYDENLNLTIRVTNFEERTVEFYYIVHVEGWDDRDGYGSSDYDGESWGRVNLDLTVDSDGYEITEGEFDEKELESIVNFVDKLPIKKYVDGNYEEEV